MLPLFFVGFTYLVAFLLGPSDFYFPLSLSSSSIWSSIWISPSSTSTSTFSTPTFSTPTFSTPTFSTSTFSTSTPPSLTIDPPVKYELVYHSFIREYYGVHIKYERVWKVVMTQPASVSWLFVEAPWSIVESSREIVEDHRACVHRNTTADVWGIKDDPYSGPKDVCIPTPKRLSFEITKKLVRSRVARLLWDLVRNLVVRILCMAIEAFLSRILCMAIEALLRLRNVTGEFAWESARDSANRIHWESEDDVLMHEVSGERDTSGQEGFTAAHSTVSGDASVEKELGAWVEDDFPEPEPRADDQDLESPLAPSKSNFAWESPARDSANASVEDGISAEQDFAIEGPGDEREDVSVVEERAEEEKKHVSVVEDHDASVGQEELEVSGDAWDQSREIEMFDREGPNFDPVTNDAANVPMNKEEQEVSGDASGRLQTILEEVEDEEMADSVANEVEDKEMADPVANEVEDEEMADPVANEVEDEEMADPVANEAALAMIMLARGLENEVEMDRGDLLENEVEMDRGDFDRNLEVPNIEAEGSNFAQGLAERPVDVEMSEAIQSPADVDVGDVDARERVDVTEGELDVAMAVQGLANIGLHLELPAWADPELAPVWGELPAPVAGELPPLELNGRDIKPLPSKTRRRHVDDQPRTVDEYYMSLSEEDRQLLVNFMAAHPEAAVEEEIGVAGAIDDYIDWDAVVGFNPEA